MDDIIIHIVNVVKGGCFCDFSSQNIVESIFNCQSSETEVVLMQKFITTAANQNILCISILIDTWITKKPSLTVSGLLFRVDLTCPVDLESFTSKHCINPAQPTDFINKSVVIWGTVAAALAIIM